MSNVVPLFARAGADPYFGVCPRCGGCGGCFDIGRDHYFYCERHNVAWCFGSNVFSGWKDTSEAQFAANGRKLASMRLVEPIYPPEGSGA